MIKRKRTLHGSMRGQTSIFDFFATVMVFVVIFTSFVLLSDKSVKDAFLASSFSETAVFGLSITESFVGNKGVPTYWETDTSTTQAIGLTEHQNSLDLAKLDAFIAMEYNESKTRMGLPEFIDYHFLIEDLNGSVLYESGSAQNGSHTTLPFTRYVVINESAGKLRLVLYE